MRNILERRKNGGIIYLRFIQFYLKKINKRDDLKELSCQV